MTWWSDFKGRVEPDAPLAERTWFRLGGPAQWMASPVDGEDLAGIVRAAQDAGVAWKVLGGGANVLVRDDGFDGVVIRLDDPAFRRVKIEGDTVVAGGGVDLMELARDCSRSGWSGLEALAGVPGTVGGAVRMNAGGRYGQFGDVVESVTAMNEQGGLERLSREALRFGYRHSELGGRIVVDATLRLRRADPAETYRRFQQVWAEKKASQPLGAASAGCVFKNPPGRSAGALIDQAGLKGTQCGGARVSQRHANFIVTDPEARTADVLELIEQTRDRVRQVHGVDLELEIDVW